MNARWENDEERRLEDHRERVVYRFEHPAGAYCYIGLTANLDERIITHCSKPNQPMFNFLARYRDNPARARQFFRVVDKASSLKEAEEKETALILSAFLEACDDPGKPMPRNRMTHEIGPESFRKIAALAERARAAHGIHEESRRVDETERRRNRKTHQIGPENFGKIAAHGIHEDSWRVDETERRLKQCKVEKARLELHYKDENGRLTRLVDTEAVSRKRAEGERRRYQILCVLLVAGLLALVAFKVA